jgi:hypothetical protein
MGLAMAKIWLKVWGLTLSSAVCPPLASGEEFKSFPDCEAATISQDKWIIDENQSNFKTYYQVDETTGLVAVKFQTVIDASFDRVASVYLENKPDQSKWMDLTKEILIIERKNPNELKSGTIVMQYIGEKPAWFISPRTILTIETRSFDTKQKRIVSKLRCTQHPDAKLLQGYAIGRIVHGQSMIEYRGPEQTYIEIEVMVDPGGLIPKWAANLAARNWPRNTARALAAQIKTGPTIMYTFFPDDKTAAVGGGMPQTP